jgi:hypothetical protein
MAFPNKDKPPSAPYVTNTQGWTDLALKRVLKEAAEGGYDKVVWTPGVEQAARYDLSKQVDRLVLHDLGDGTSELNAFKNGELIFSEDLKNTNKELSNYVGKDVASKLMEQKSELTGNGLQRELAGQDLSLGGEGMKGYYDKIVPAQLSKLLKKMDPDVKLGKEIIPNNEEGWHLTPPDETVAGKWMLKTSDYSSKGIHFNNEAEAKAALAQKLSENAIETPSITITPKMREAILGGMPHMAEGGEVKQSNADAVHKALRELRVVAEGHRVEKPKLAYLIRQMGVTAEEAASYAQNILNENLNNLSYRLRNNPQAISKIKQLTADMKKMK